MLDSRQEWQMSQITEIFRRIISQSLYRRATWKREVAEVRRCCEDFKSRSSEDIEKIANRLRTVLMREQDMSVQPPWQRLREAVSLAIRAVEGTRSIRLHDVQIFGVLCICRGMATEIQTGEGKSVVAAVAAISLAILGRRTHIATTNNYLAFRDYQEFLVSASQVGISMGCIDGSQTPQIKSTHYKCDIVYGAGFQFGFDYLRQQSELSKRSRRAVGQYTLDALRYETSESWTAELSPFVLADVVIVDEADSVLIDEAMSPLVLSEVQGEAQDSLLLREADRVALNLQMGVDFRLTAQGTIEWINGHHTRPSSQIATDRNFESDSIPENNTHARRTWSGYLLNALKAHHCFTNGVQYVVKDSRVCVVDTSTGRLHPERLFQNGLHEAIEIKEGLVPTGKSKILARVTRQAFFRKYPLLAGMSGTLTPVMQEIRTLFRAPYVSVPENTPSRRRHLPTRLFRDKEAKHRAISEDCLHRIKRKQPVLIGTRSIRESQQLFEQFRRLGIEATLLNGMQDEDESIVIKKLGCLACLPSPPTWLVEVLTSQSHLWSRNMEDYT